MSKLYYQGETMPQEVEVTDQTGVLTDPDTIVITIVDPEGTKVVDEESMSYDATGKYYYNYVILF